MLVLRIVAARQPGTSMNSAAEEQKSRPRSEVGRALCQFPGGQRRVLYLTRLGPRSADIQCLTPPPVGAPISLTFELETETSSPPVSARVVSTLLDTETGEPCGFTAVFSAMSSQAFQAVRGAVGQLTTLSSSAPGPERRRAPRIWVDTPFVASIETPNGVRGARVVTMSIAGALLGFSESDPLDDLTPGTRITVDIVLESVPEVVTVPATIVRRNAPSEPYGLGIRFVDMDSQTRARIEGVLLYVLGDASVERSARR